ncbi:MAG TPA: beta-ketoacyl synthase N-terminal-like domain-containing protein [Candidatus Methylacidiphilales bacterium]|nr:beta-ketoacyl synthase N-terminal-like domain-containing protein [Candidatus Methylacidiphilales bacterium]
MKTDLAVIGQGAVTPAGIGTMAVCQGHPAENMIPLVSRPDRKWPVFRINLNDPALANWQKEARLRRASPIGYFLMEAAGQALADQDAAARAQTGLIIAFSTGCLAYSRRFFESIITQGQKTASPALFPETVFNSPVSHVAATFHLEGSAYALAGDETAWVTALKIAWLWLEEERVKQVLVMGAEEFDSASLDAYQNAGWLKQRQSQPAFIPAEGAAGVLLRRAQANDSKIISQLEEGFIYRRKKEAAAAAQRCLQCFNSDLPCFSTAQRHWLRDIEWQLTQARRFEAGAHVYLGEAVTASAAWNTLRALGMLAPEHPQLLLPVWGGTHQIGALKMEYHDRAAD